MVANGGDGGDRARDRGQTPEGAGLIGRAYGTAKWVWAWGKTVPAAGAVLGLYEGAASAAVSTVTGAGMDLPSADREISSWIDGVDRDVVGPVLRQLLLLLTRGQNGDDRLFLENRSTSANAGGGAERRDEIPPEVTGNESLDQPPENVFLDHLEDQLSNIDATFRRRAAEAAIRARQLHVAVVAPIKDLIGEERPPPVHLKSLEEENCIRNALSASILFTRLDDSVRQTLVDAFEPVSVTKGSNIMCKGDKGDYFYVLQSGIVYVTADVDLPPTGVILEGEAFGGIALLFDCPRVVTCTAETDCRVLRLDRDTFRRVVEGYHARNDDDTMALLKNVPLFQDFDDDTLTRIACSVSTQTVREGDVIFHKGDGAEMFCLVKEGRVKATDITTGGRKYDECTFGPGESFGDDAIVRNSPYICNVIALETTTLLCINGAAFMKVMGSYDDLLRQNVDQKMLKAIPVNNKPQLTQNEVEELSSAIVDTEYEKGHVFYSVGETVVPALYLVRSGEINLEDSSCVDKTVTKGGYFGEVTLVGDIRVPVVAKETIVAKENCRVGVLKGGDIDAVLGLAACDTVDPDGLTKHRILGEGTFGQVWCVSKAGDSSNGKAYALKVQYKRQLIESELADGAIREKNMMTTLNSKFVIRLLGTHQDEHRIFMLTSLYQGGELWSVIHDGDRHGLPESFARFYAANVLVGLTHMHRRRILHRDMKPANVLLDNDGWAVIIDLGTAKFVPGTSKTYTLCGTPLYLAPEVIQRSGHGKGADLWSWGVMVFEMLCGMTPFDDPDETANQMDIFKNIVEGHFTFPSGSHVSSSARDLIAKVLAVDPTNRLGNLARAEKDIHDHDWFQVIDFAKLKCKEAEVPWVPGVRDALDTSNFDSEAMYANKQCWEELPLDKAEQQMFKDF